MLISLCNWLSLLDPLFYLKLKTKMKKTLQNLSITKQIYADPQKTKTKKEVAHFLRFLCKNGSTLIWRHWRWLFNLWFGQYLLFTWTSINLSNKLWKKFWFREIFPKNIFSTRQSKILFYPEFECKLLQ